MTKTELHKKIVDFIRSRFPDAGFIPLHEPRFSGKEKEYVIDAIDSTYVSSVGEYVNRFESMMAGIAGTRYAVACVNGTAALHLALKVAGVKPKEIVITQSLSFIATCNAISYIGAEPVFVDVDRDTMGMSPGALESWLLDNTYTKDDIQSGRKICCFKDGDRRIAAVVPMHTFGHPVRIDRIAEICETHHIPLVEDAAESIGSYYNDKHTGSFGLLGTFSFNGNKTVTCGGGGAIVTDNEEIAKLAKHLSTQAKRPHAWEFDHDANGYNYRLPNLNAAMACAQLEQLEDFVANKRKLAAEYEIFFSDIQDVQFVSESAHAKANYWLNAILFGDIAERNAFLELANAEKVMSRPVWNLMHTLPMYLGAIRGSMENSEYISERLVNIPSSVRL